MEELRRQVGRAQRWLGVQRFLGSLGWWCFGMLWLALGMILVDKFQPLGVEPWVWLAGGFGLGVVGASFWAVIRGRGPLDAAVEIDRRFGLKERVSSTLAMSDNERNSETGQALILDAVRRVERVDVGSAFAVSPGKQLLLPFLPAAIALAVIWLVSPVVDQQAMANAAAAKKQVQQSTADLKRKLVEQRKKAQEKGLEEAQALFRRLEEETENLSDKADADKKQALVKLNDLSRQIEARQRQLDGAGGIRKQFERLGDMGRGPAEKFLAAVADGNLRQAVRELRKLKADLDQGRLSDEQRQQLAKQLNEMKKKLNEAIEEQRRQEQELENRIKQAEAAGQKREAERLEQQLDNLRQQMPKINNLEDLANKLGQCAKCLGEGQLDEAGDLLDQLQADVGDLQEQLQEMEMLDDAMDQLCQAREQMNCQQCGGMGCQACQGNGNGLGEGQGRGDRPEQENDVGFFDTKTPQKIGRGSATIAGEVAGPNFTGNIQQELQEELTAAKAETADPLTEQRIPRAHRRHAREYFDRLREGE